MIGKIFLKRYEAVRVLGEGGMGVVYLARQHDLGRQVVVKVMHDHIAADPKFRERFERETLVMARFQHPYVVTLYDASLDEENGPCIVMEYVRGVTLDALRIGNKGRLSPGRVGRLLGQLCEALQAAHNEGIIHRDLKPGNLMVVESDSPHERIKIMDFGLAKLVEPGNRKKISDTEVEFIVGTPAYICPEQFSGVGIDHRGDIYSVGVILYELLTGRLPFANRNTMELMLAQVTDPVPPFGDVTGSWVPPDVEAVVLSCLAKDPAERPQNATELAELFERALYRSQELAEEEPPTGASQPGGPDDAKAAGHPHDPTLVVHKMEAWMPEAIAIHKLRGFVEEAGGEVLESSPGLIRVRLGKQDSGSWSFMGLGKRSRILEMELHLERSNPNQSNLLNVTVTFRSPTGAAYKDTRWRDWCNQVYCELRAYLMGK